MSKGGKQTSTVEVPAWLENGGKELLGRAEDVSRIGYTPYYGPDVAAMNGQQIGAMNNTQDAAQAFGMAAPNPMRGMPQAQDFGGGVQGYSSGPLFERALRELKAARPAQFAAYEAQFIDPKGKAASKPAAPAAKPAPAPAKAPAKAATKKPGSGGGGGTDRRTGPKALTPAQRAKAVASKKTPAKAATPAQTRPQARPEPKAKPKIDKPSERSASKRKEKRNYQSGNTRINRLRGK